MGRGGGGGEKEGGGFCWTFGGERKREKIGVSTKLVVVLVVKRLKKKFASLSLHTVLSMIKKGWSGSNASKYNNYNRV